MNLYTDLSVLLEKNQKIIMKETPPVVFGKSMKNVGKHRDIKLVKIEIRRSYSVSKSNYHTINWFSKNLLEIEMNKTKVKMERPVYLGLFILDIVMSQDHI